MVQAVRGAVQLIKDESSLIENGVRRMVEEIININSIPYEDLISIQFSITGDLRSKNPATALRAGGFSTVPRGLLALFPSQIAHPGPFYPSRLNLIPFSVPWI